MHTRKPGSQVLVRVKSINIAFLTCIRRGACGLALEEAVKSPKLDVVGVIFSSEPRRPPLSKRIIRRVRKIAKIGVLGALNGLRLREWFQHLNAKDIFEAAAQTGVPIFEVEWMNSDEVAQLLGRMDVDLGVSLGCGYLGARVFTSPRFGIINYHGELLPEYPGAQSILWAIHNGARNTGFTVHRINARIDGGEILLRREFPIKFRRTLRATVEATQRDIHPHLPAAIRQVCENFEELLARAEKQSPRRSFTTPSFDQFLRMMRNNRRFFNLSLRR
jgi:methionyl-tRNA formyltransferase